MKKKLSKAFKLSKKDGLKSCRDAVLVALGALVPHLLEIANTVDFGEYTQLVSIMIAMLAPLANRFLRNK